MPEHHLEGYAQKASKPVKDHQLAQGKAEIEDKAEEEEHESEDESSDDESEDEE